VIKVRWALIEAKFVDDAAGLGISENLKSQIRSYSQATRNANDGISMIQVAEGGLTEISNIMTRLRELAIQSSSDTVGATERGYIQKEATQLTSEVQRIAKTNRFGKISLLDGTSGTFDIQVGLNNKQMEDRISFKASELDATAGNLAVEDLDLNSKENAQDSLKVLDNAQEKVSGYRATLGALQNRMDSAVSNLAVQHENLSAANSRIRDADIAQSAADQAKNSVLLQASTATLAQANQQPALALKLMA